MANPSSIAPQSLTIVTANVISPPTLCGNCANFKIEKSRDFLCSDDKSKIQDGRAEWFVMCSPDQMTVIMMTKLMMIMTMMLMMIMAMTKRMMLNADVGGTE